MNITEQTIVGDLVAKDYRTASVFKKQGIDFCCAGNRTIAEACAKKSIDPALVIGNLEEVTTKTNNPVADYNSWPLDLLADYVEKKHHRYVQEKIVEIVPFLNKVASVHGGRHPELLEVQDLFRGCVEELTAHMQKEEQILFPLLRDGLLAQAAGPISVMEREHEEHGDNLETMVRLTDDITPPPFACVTWRALYTGLNQLREDLMAHIHLENNVLFPAVAMALEVKG